MTTDNGHSPYGVGPLAEGGAASSTASPAKPSVPSAFAAIQEQINADPEYAWAWFCNITVPIIDASRLSNEEADTAAANIMATIFNCDITTHPQFKGVKSWAQDYFEIRIAAEREEDAQTQSTSSGESL